MIRFVFLALTLVLAPPLAATRAPTPTPPLRGAVVARGITEDALGANSQTKVARDAAGAVYVAFVAPVGDTAHVFLGTSTDGGASWRTLRMTEGAAARLPALAIGPDRDIHLAWTAFAAPAGQVYYRRVRAGRATPPVRVSPGPAYAGVPAIAIDPAGLPHLAWYGIRLEAPEVRTRHGSIYEVLYSRQDAGGGWAAPEVISPGIPDSLNPALAADAGGRLYAAWYQFDGRTYQARAAVRDGRDGRWGDPVQVSRGDDDAFAVAMAVGPEGTAALVWERREPSGPRVYFAERRDAAWTVPIPVSPLGERATHPTVAIDPRGTVYVAWEREEAVVLRRRTSAWEPAQQVASGSTPVIAGSRGAVDLVWIQREADGTVLRFASLEAPAAPSTPAVPPPAPLHRRALLLAPLLVVLLWLVWWLTSRRAARRGS